MRHFYICLIYHGIMQGCIDFHMPQHLLHLFYRHTLVNSHCCQSPAELMRMYLMQIYFLAQLSQVEGTKRSVYLRERPKMVEEPRIEIVR